RPGSQQSIIFSGYLTVPRANDKEAGIQLMNNILGSDFTSRVNMNLREDKHWTYGAASFLWDAKGQRMHITYSPVQGDKTADAMKEIQKEMEMIIGENPPTQAEFTKTQSNVILGLPGSWETIAQVSGSLAEIVQYNLPDNYFQEYPAKVHSLTVQDIDQAAKMVIKPNALVWVIVGDKSKIEESIKALGFEKIHHMDADGNLL
ncbi:MAG: insulinase family protein, partial [Calditrichaeota bacterium]